jgi:spermidine synthase
MADDRGGPIDEGHPNPDILVVLLPLFVVSGCAALIYEVVWLQLLQLVVGSTAVSMGIVLSTYMGGMCLGSLAVPRYISRRTHPLHVYACLEAAIGVMALAIIHGMPYVERLYTLGAGGFGPSLALRAVVSIVCLLPPTVAMGATLPAIARWVEATPRGVAWLGFLYTGNIIGGVTGCLLAGFHLLRLYSMVKATYVAVELNAAAAFLAAVVAWATPYRHPQDESAASARAAAPAGSVAIYLAIGLSGFAALGAEVVWTRLLSLTLGATVYTFSIILAVFLFGLGIGSGVGSLVARTSRQPSVALGWCQFLLAGAIGWSAYAIAQSLPYWPVSPGLAVSPWYTFQLDLARCAWATLPAAMGWGASFPLALAASASQEDDAGRLVARTYSANTIGAILGATLFGVVLIPTIGTQGAQRVLVVSSVVAALAAWIPALRAQRPLFPSRGATTSTAALAVALSAATGLATLVGIEVPPPNCSAVAYGRRSGEQGSQLAPGIVEEKDVPQGKGSPSTYCTFIGEGMNVSVAVTKTRAGVRSFHGAGKIQASNSPQDMRFQRMLGHITSLTFKDHSPASVLVVAFGAGVTAGSFVPYDSVKRIVICDIEPMVPKHVGPMFAKENYGVAEDPRTQIVLDDGRHFMRTTSEKFDIITSDPIDPWVKGCAALNTEEYYRMSRARLNPGGIMALWMPFYESNLETTKSLIATFFKVFPHGILWSNDLDGKGFDAVLFGSVDPLVIDVDELEQWLDRHPKVKTSLEDVGFGTQESPRPGETVAIDLLATYAGRASDMRGWLEGAQINTDRNLRLQYLAGMWFNSYRSNEIFWDILRYYRVPSDLFVGRESTLRSLRLGLEDNGRKPVD